MLRILLVLSMLSTSSFAYAEWACKFWPPFGSWPDFYSTGDDEQTAWNNGWSDCVSYFGASGNAHNCSSYTHQCYEK